MAAYREKKCYAQLPIRSIQATLLVKVSRTQKNFILRRYQDRAISGAENGKGLEALLLVVHGRQLAPAKPKFQPDLATLFRHTRDGGYPAKPVFSEVVQQAQAPFYRQILCIGRTRSHRLVWTPACAGVTTVSTRAAQPTRSRSPATCDEDGNTLCSNSRLSIPRCSASTGFNTARRSVVGLRSRFS